MRTVHSNLTTRLDDLASIEPERIRLRVPRITTVEATSGTYESSPPDSETSAFFPRQDWSHADVVEPLDDFSGIGSELRNSVVVTHISDAALDMARTELLPGISNSQDPIINRRVLERVRVEMEGQLTRNTSIRCFKPGPADCVIQRPGLVSTAFDFSSGHFIGLHIDNHQKLPLDLRAETDILFAVNIGFSHRYFLFLPYTARGLQMRLPARRDKAETDSIGLKDRFLYRYSDEPVLRLRLEPGEAYLCAPQNLIHDGATSETGSADVALLMSGDYR